MVRIINRLPTVSLLFPLGMTKSVLFQSTLLSMAVAAIQNAGASAEGLALIPLKRIFDRVRCTLGGTWGNSNTPNPNFKRKCLMVSRTRPAITNASRNTTNLRHR